MHACLCQKTKHMAFIPFSSCTRAASDPQVPFGACATTETYGQACQHATTETYVYMICARTCACKHARIALAPQRQRQCRHLHAHDQCMHVRMQECAWRVRHNTNIWAYMQFVECMHAHDLRIALQQSWLELGELRLAIAAHALGIAAHGLPHRRKAMGDHWREPCWR